MISKVLTCSADHSLYHIASVTYFISPLFFHRLYTWIKSPNIINVMLNLIIFLTWKKIDQTKKFHFHEFVFLLLVVVVVLESKPQASCMINDKLCPHPMVLCYVSIADTLLHVGTTLLQRIVRSDLESKLHKSLQMFCTDFQFQAPEQWP